MPRSGRAQGQGRARDHGLGRAAAGRGMRALSGRARRGARGENSVARLRLEGSTIDPMAFDGGGSERLVLVVRLPTGGEKEVELVAPKLVIGRSSSGQVVIEDPSVSRAHAEIEVTNGRAVFCVLWCCFGTSVFVLWFGFVFV